MCAWVVGQEPAASRYPQLDVTEEETSQGNHHQPLHPRPGAAHRLHVSEAIQLQTWTTVVLFILDAWQERYKVFMDRDPIVYPLGDIAELCIDVDEYCVSDEAIKG